jgi:hypothetical protein
LAVIEKVVLMATARGELAIDLMSGSGTTGAACQSNERYAILCDVSEEYTRIAEERLGVSRVGISDGVVEQVLHSDTGLPQKPLDLPDSAPTSVRRRKSGTRQLDFGVG